MGKIGYHKANSYPSIVQLENGMFVSKNHLIKELKSMCLPRFNEVCESAGLSKIQYKVMLERCNRGQDILSTSYNLGVCETSVKAHYRVAINRLLDYGKYVEECV